LQLELLDERHWTGRRQLAAAIFEWIECWYWASPGTVEGF
jgi:putative transposase